MKNIICIEGVVGAGKTTLGQLLAEELSYKFFQEPYIDNPFLDKFYSNKKRYSLSSQLYFLDKRVDIIKETQKFDTCIIDRTIYGDYLFAKMHYKNGYMTEDEFKLYEAFWKKFILTSSSPLLIIYLEINTDNAMKKIEERGRNFELEVEKEYWESLNEEYSEFFNTYRDSVVLKININNMDIRDNLEDREQFFNMIKSKLKELL